MTIADINTLARFLVDADTTTYTAANLLITVNNAYEEVVNEIIRSDRTWEFDDLNFNTFPIFTDDLIASQNDYALDNTFLNVIKVHILNSNGDFQELRPLDITALNHPIDEVFEVDGMPVFYDLRYGSVWLYPAPSSGDTTLSGGIRIYAQRGADTYTSAQVTTGTKQPGFAIHHEILAYKAALPFAQAYRKDRVPFLIGEVGRRMEQILEHYAQREKGTRKIIKVTGINPQ